MSCLQTAPLCASKHFLLPSLLVSTETGEPAEPVNVLNISPVAIGELTMTCLSDQTRKNRALRKRGEEINAVCVLTAESRRIMWTDHRQELRNIKYTLFPPPIIRSVMLQRK